MQLVAKNKNVTAISSNSRSINSRLEHAKNFTQ